MSNKCIWQLPNPWMELGGEDDQKNKNKKNPIWRLTRHCMNTPYFPANTRLISTRDYWWITVFSPGAGGCQANPRPGTGSLPRLAAANVHLHCSRMWAGGSPSLCDPAALTLHAAAQRGGADVVLGLLLLLVVVVGGGAVVVAARVVGTGSRHCWVFEFHQRRRAAMQIRRWWWWCWRGGQLQPFLPNTASRSAQLATPGRKTKRTWVLERLLRRTQARWESWGKKETLLSSGLRWATPGCSG